MVCKQQTGTRFFKKKNILNQNFTVNSGTQLKIINFGRVTKTINQSNFRAEIESGTTRRV